MVRLVVLLVIAGLAVGACGGDGDGDGGSAEAGAGFTTLARGDQGPAEPGQVVARSAAEWEQAWAGAGGPGPAPAATGVDFGRQVVVGVFQGQRPSAGYAVRVEAATRVPGGTELHYLLVSPPADCLTASVITSPYQVVAVTHPGGEVTFTADTEPGRGCS